MITREVLESHLHCRYKGHLKLGGHQGEPTDYERLRREARERVRLAATDLLLRRNRGGEVLRGASLTPEVLRRGVPLLLDATLEGEGLSVRFDALLRVPGPSPCGDFHYLPVLFHEAERPTKELRALLQLLGLLLGTVQGAEPAAGVLVHGRGCEVRRLKLRPKDGRARRLLEELRARQGGGGTPRLLLNAHCQVCEFRRRCHAEATAKDDLSLLRGMPEAEVRGYARRGLFTVTQLSFTFRPPRRAKKPGERRCGHSHALQALAIREKKVHVLGSPELPASPRRLYLDLEGDPEQAFCYLATILVQDGQAQEWHTFWIDSPAQEPELLSRVLDVATRHPDAWLYAYGGYEAAFLRRAAKPARREAEAAAVLARLCNVLSVVHHHVYFPVYGNGLKEVARHLGFAWADPDASGVQSVVWRRRWEESGLPAWKEKLLTYNREDCEALRKVTEFLYAIQPGQPPAAAGTAGGPEGCPVTRVDEMTPASSRREWCRAQFAVPDFQFVNERAYFDYQRDRVYVRTSKALRKSRSRNRGRQGKRNIPINRRVVLSAAVCPFCGSADLARTPNKTLTRFAFDLRVTAGGIRRWVTRYRTSYHDCAACRRRFLPWEYLRLDPHGHALKSWAMNQHVVYRITLANVAVVAKESFGLPVFYRDVRDFKVLLARHYDGTVQRLLAKLVAGPLLHADETEVHLKDGSKGYVWVFASLEEAVFLYRPSREGGFLAELLKDFRGVLVSDFYAAYDSLGCPQQKCLIHLIRDFNEDIRGNPWDEELKSVAGDFGALLRAAVATIDEHGLKRRHLGQHKPAVARFWASLEGRQFRSEVAEGYQKRLLKYRAKLFTFLEHDGVPWNNNNAEYAIKRFAYYREVADGLVHESGLKQYLVLLSLRVSCVYRGVNFLRFLLSRETDLDAFCERPGRRRPVPEVELQPDGWTNTRRKRVQGWAQEIQAK
jgi:predicted RecB family nuclease